LTKKGMQMFDTIVIGGGQAGLATGYHLKRAGLDYAILEANQQPTGSWASYYDSLKLFSPARYSSLPGFAFPGHPDRYPLRDEVVAYLSDYAKRFDFPILTQTSVNCVEKEGKNFRIFTQDGKEFQAHTVIVATGAFNHPHLPQIPGQEVYQGTILHSASYKTPYPFKNQRVVVIGGGNSALQIAVELAQFANVSLATRQPIRFISQCIFGRDIHFWARYIGFDRLPLNEKSSPNVLDTGIYRAAIAIGKPDRRPMFGSFTEKGVLWTDRTVEDVDTVIFATGFKPNHTFLQALNGGSVHYHRAGISSTTSGLYYVGVSGQRSFASATLRGVGADAHHVIRHLRRYLQATGLKKGA
jgi:putative flavoprotein involved in K+ transport